MEKKQAWLRLVQEKSAHYLNLGDGGFDERMRARLVDCDYEGQTVTYAFPTQDWQINEKGGIHGGAIATLADTVAGSCACSRGGNCVTCSSTMEYLRPAYGDLFCEATPKKLGRRLSVIQVEIRNAQGKTVATGTLTFFMEVPKKSDR